MAVQRKYPGELRKRTMKMVLETLERDGKGIHPEALRSRVKQTETDGSERPGTLRAVVMIS